ARGTPGLPRRARRPDPGLRPGPHRALAAAPAPGRRLRGPPPGAALPPPADPGSRGLTTPGRPARPVAAARHRHPTGPPPRRPFTCTRPRRHSVTRTAPGRNTVTRTAPGRNTVTGTPPGRRGLTGTPRPRLIRTGPRRHPARRRLARTR